MDYHFWAFVQLLSAIRYILGPIQCCLCYLMIWCCYFHFIEKKLSLSELIYLRSPCWAVTMLGFKPSSVFHPQYYTTFHCQVLLIKEVLN